MEKSQIDEISDLLLSYSAGHYHVKGEVSENFDEIDMIISGINMLGEELRSTNVSKEYFSSIFNAVTDLVMVANENGILLDLNEAVGNVLGYSQEELLGNSIFKILNPQNQHVFSNLKEELAKNIKNYIFEGELIKSDKELVFGLFTCSKIFDRAGSFNGYLVSVKDITAQKENEKLILKTIISTQGAEQRRVADDLHDSLGQELSMAQLMLSNLNRFKVEDKEFYNLLELCNDILNTSVMHLRDICFDLMPNVLVKGGLASAVEMLVGKLEKSEKLQIDFVCTEKFARLLPELEIVIYRIIQEFINNMIKHSIADNLKIHLIEHEKSVEIKLVENGQGFDLAKLDNVGENRGMYNIKTKVLAYNGQYNIKSEALKGTELWLEFPKI